MDENLMRFSASPVTLMISASGRLTKIEDDTHDSPVHAERSQGTVTKVADGATIEVDTAGQYYKLRGS